MRQLAAGVLMLVMCLQGAPMAYAQGVERFRDQTAAVVVDVFTNVAGDPGDAWIGQGFAETLTVDLGGVVMSGSPRWRVVGAYQRVGRELRITSQLVDSGSGQVVAAFRLDGNESEIFRLQDELGRRLADQLGDVAQLPDGTSVTVAAMSGLEGDPPVGLPTASLLPGGRAESGAVVIDGPPPPPLPEVVARDSQGRMTIRAIRLGEPLELDGLLQESVYSDVPAVTDFIQQEPSEGASATDQTEVWVTFDDEMLYVSARCWSEAPDSIVANEMKRDGYGMFGNDTFSVLLDTFYDRRSAFGFMTNPVGGLSDLLIANERLSNMDWNTVWNVATTRFDQGWIVEMAIPFRSLRYRPGDSQVWGIGIQRSVAAKNERSYLTPIPRSLGFDGLTRVSLAAALVDVEVPASGVRLELKPYAISDVTTNVNAAPPVLNQLSGQVGFDMKYGLTPGLTADFTYNTDFAQVEVDEQQINLTRFSLFYPEKREFFLEGQGVFDFGAGFRDDYKTFYFGGGQFAGTAPIMFFSRRIGLQGGGTVPIQAGGRLTGKAGPYSIGLLNVQTGREREAGVASTNFSAVRMRRDILRRSSVGALFTGRSVSLDGQGSNETFGVDGVFSFYDNVKINAYMARTRTAGINHDDSSHQVQFNYNGDRWGVVAERLAVGENFNPEVGFVPRDDFKRNYAEFRFSPRPLRIDAVRKFMFEGNLDYTTDGAGALATRLQQGLFGIEFANGDWFFAGMTDNYEWLKNPFDITPDITIPVGDYSFVNARVVYALGMQRVVSGGVTVDHGGFFGGERTGLGYTFGRVNLSPQLSVEPSLSFNRIDLPQGDFSTELVSVRTTYTLTPRMFVAGLVQYNSTFDSLGTNLRFRWEYQPGSELFVVYTDERDTLNPRWSFVENRAFVVKATRLFRF